MYEVSGARLTAAAEAAVQRAFDRCMVGASGRHTGEPRPFVMSWRRFVQQKAYIHRAKLLGEKAGSVVECAAFGRSHEGDPRGLETWHRVFEKAQKRIQNRLVSSLRRAFGGGLSDLRTHKSNRRARRGRNS